MIYQDVVCFVIYIALDSLRFLSLWIFFLTSFRNCTIIYSNIATALFSFLLVGFLSHVVRSSGLVHMTYTLLSLFFSFLKFFVHFCCFFFSGVCVCIFFCGGDVFGCGASFWLCSIYPIFLSSLTLSFAEYNKLLTNQATLLRNNLHMIKLAH